MKCNCLNMARCFDLNNEEGHSIPPVSPHTPGQRGRTSEQWGLLPISWYNGLLGMNSIGALGVFIFRQIKNLQQALKVSPVMQREDTLGWEWESLIADC